MASVADFRQFANANKFGAWLGLAPSQGCSSGKARLGPITQRSDDYLRKLLTRVRSRRR